MFGKLFKRKSAKDDELKRLLVRIARTLERIEVTLASLETSSLPHGEFSAAVSLKPIEQEVKTEVFELKDSRTTAVFNDPEPVIDYLKSKGFSVIKFNEAVEKNQIFDNYALRFGRYYPLFQEFLDALKRSYHTGRNIRVDVSNLTPDEKSLLIQTSKELYSNALLDYSYYKRNSNALWVHLNIQNEEGREFLLGKWLERYILLTSITSLLEKTSLTPFSFATNVHVVTPRQQSAEFDVILKLNDEIIWIEAKTGEYQSFVGKYAEIRKELELARSQAMLVISGIDRMIANNLSENFCLTVLPVEDFEEEINKYILRHEAMERNALGL